MMNCNIPARSPGWTIRDSDMSGEYGAIITDTFMELCTDYETLTQIEYPCLESNLLQEKIQQKSLIVMVFSAMCLEGYLNLYGAVALGDDEFYSKHERTSAVNKFDMICQDILKLSEGTYSKEITQIKELFDNRNYLAHSKSKEYTPTEIYVRECDPDEKTPLDTTRDRYELEKAEKAFHTVRDIALFFDSHDCNALATTCVFFTHILHQHYEENPHPDRIEFLKKHGIVHRFRQVKCNEIL